MKRYNLGKIIYTPSNKYAPYKRNKKPAIQRSKCKYSNTSKKKPKQPITFKVTILLWSIIGSSNTKVLEEVPEASLAGFPDNGNNGPPGRFGVPISDGKQNTYSFNYVFFCAGCEGKTCKYHGSNNCLPVFFVVSEELPYGFYQQKLQINWMQHVAFFWPFSRI